MVTYLKSLKEKLDRQVGSDFLRRVVRYQGYKGLSNLARVSLTALQKEHPGKVSYLPPCLFIEVTNRCNLTCPTCQLGNELAYKGYNQADLTFEQVKSIIDQIPSLIYVTLQGVGEPLMNKDIMKMIRYCTDKGISTYINTNGTFLNEKRAHELLDAGLTDLSISVNSFDEKVFADTRSGASIKKVAENAQKFLDIRKSRNVKRPVVSFRAILMKETEPHMEELVLKSAAMGIDVLYIQLFVDYIADKRLWQSSLPEDAVAKLSEKLEWLKKQVKMSIVTESFGESSNNLGQCKLPWFSPNVTAEGFVTPCCTISNPSIINMGNIFESSFEEIWNSEKFVNFRGGFYRKQPGPCVGCPSYKLS